MTAQVRFDYVPTAELEEGIGLQLADKESARILQEAAVAGIQDWDGHPFPRVIDDGAIPLRIPDIEVVWTEGLNNAAAGVSTNSTKPDGKGLKFKSHGIAVVVPPMEMGPALRVRVLEESANG